MIVLLSFGSIVGLLIFCGEVNAWLLWLAWHRKLRALCCRLSNKETQEKVALKPFFPSSKPLLSLSRVPHYESEWKEVGLGEVESKG